MNESTAHKPAGPYRLGLCLSLLAFATGTVFLSGPALAVTFTVNSTADIVDANSGDGICATSVATGSVCTLRAAIQESNALAGADIIILPSGTYTLTIAGANEDFAATGDLDIYDNLTITGAGATTTSVNGGGLDRVFDIDPPDNGPTVNISGITITGGSVPSDSGGGVYNNGGGTADTTLTNVMVVVNVATSGAGIAVGSSTTMTINSSTIAANINFGGNGAGIFNDGTLMVTNSTISTNVATGDGYGGGIYGASGSQATVQSSTIANNATALASGGGNLYTNNLFTTAAITLYNSIVAISAGGGNCNSFGSGVQIVSLGYNLDSANTCGFASAGDLINTNPLLGALAANGGQTLTHALPFGSPAVDAGNNTGCPTTDQRGVARPADGDGNATATCDIGAYELLIPNINVIPLPVSFGNVTIGSGGANLTVTVANTGTADLVLGTITAPAAPFARVGGSCTNGQTLLPGGSCTIAVRFTPTAAGAAAGSFSIPSNDPNVGTANGQNNVLVNLTGTGVAPPADPPPGGSPPPPPPPPPPPGPTPPPGPGGGLPPDLSNPPLWPFTVPGASGEALVADATGVVVAGYASNGANSDLLLARFDTGGVKQWERRLDLGGHEFGYGLAQDSVGRLTV
ncbi:MAG: choice-of-anchor D domain-containing protein, partial [Gammaproteobacteria bacterium]|nr:choice-of-anchor D domain-containing protein [Gammaproteobacteria bacterium]